MVTVGWATRSTLDSPTGSACSTPSAELGVAAHREPQPSRSRLGVNRFTDVSLAWRSTRSTLRDRCEREPDARGISPNVRGRTGGGRDRLPGGVKAIWSISASQAEPWLEDTTRFEATEERPLRGAARTSRSTMGVHALRVAVLARVGPDGDQDELRCKSREFRATKWAGRKRGIDGLGANVQASEAELHSARQYTRARAQRSWL